MPQVSRIDLLPYEIGADITCNSTLRTQCLPAGSATGTDVSLAPVNATLFVYNPLQAVDYFLTVERLFKAGNTPLFLTYCSFIP
jgi:hypothetical protein